MDVYFHLNFVSKIGPSDISLSKYQNQNNIVIFVTCPSCAKIMSTYFVRWKPPCCSTKPPAKARFTSGLSARSVSTIKQGFSNWNWKNRSFHFIQFLINSHQKIAFGVHEVHRLKVYLTPFSKVALEQNLNDISLINIRQSYKKLTSILPELTTWILEEKNCE